MEGISKYIENKKFIQWIYQPSQELEQWWKSYEADNPGEKINIQKARNILLKFQTYNKDLPRDEKIMLFSRVLKQIEEKENRKKVLRPFTSILKYAAVAILFLSIGSGISYLLMDKNQPNQFVGNIPMQLNIQEPTLIIENEQEISLSHGESEIKYSNNGEITIDKDMIIEGANEETASRINTLVIPYGNRSTIFLSDGTKVVLNAGSRLVYPSKFVDKNREVLLVGEAFFEVERNENKPFIVKTPDMEVEVLGTKFNISAYPEDNIVQTVLTEGKVEIGLANPGFFDKKIQLLPGQLAKLDKSEKSTIVQNVDIEYYTSWTEGIFSFYATDLSRIVKRLERYFNIRFIYNDPLNGSVKISGKLDVTKEKEEVFEYMTKLTGLNFIKINEKNYRIK